MTFQAKSDFNNDKRFVSFSSTLYIPNLSTVVDIIEDCKFYIEKKIYHKYFDSDKYETKDGKRFCFMNRTRLLSNTSRTLISVPAEKAIGHKHTFEFRATTPEHASDIIKFCLLAQQVSENLEIIFVREENQNWLTETDTIN